VVIEDFPSNVVTRVDTFNTAEARQRVIAAAHSNELARVRLDPGELLTWLSRRALRD
jgi:hypothetical protein